MGAGARPRCACRAASIPTCPGSFYFDLLDAVKARVAGHPHPRLQPHGGPERRHEARHLVPEFLAEAQAHGLGSIPGTAAEILDDEVRWVLTKGKLPADTWEEIVRTAHELGIRSAPPRSCTATSTPRRTGSPTSAGSRASKPTPAGSPSSCRCPSCTRTRRSISPGKARPGATFEEDLRMHAVARILLDGVIHNVQVSWVKLGVEASQAILQSGANDFGGTLMEETISRMAGAEWGISMAPERFDDAIRAIGRTPAVRTTTYERVAVRSIAPRTRSVKLIDRKVNPLDHTISPRIPLHIALQARHDGRDDG